MQHILNVVAAVDEQDAQQDLCRDDPCFTTSNPWNEHWVNNGWPQQLETVWIGGKRECAELCVRKHVLKKEGECAKHKTKGNTCIVDG